MQIQHYHYQELDSTNTQAVRILKSRPDSRYVLVTSDIQTAGKGSRGRIWHSDNSGGLYYSLGFKPELFDTDAIPEFVLSVAEEIRQIIIRLAYLNPQIKAPNDLLINGRKVCGILIETSFKMNKKIPNYVVIGLGLNINQTEFPESLSGYATSLRLEGQRVFEKAVFRDECTRSLIRLLSDWKIISFFDHKSCPEVRII